MRFSFLLTIREKVDYLQAFLRSLLNYTRNKGLIEVIAIVDNDDHSILRHVDEFAKKFAEINLRFLLRSPSEWFCRDYINYAYNYSTGKFIVVVSDALSFLKDGWDDYVWQELESYLANKPDGVACSTFDSISIISRRAIDALGFVMPNDRRFGGEQDLQRIFSHQSINRIVNLPELIVEYRHTDRSQRHEINKRLEKIQPNSVPIELFIERVTHHINQCDHKDNNKILVVYNICGISGKENPDYYCTAINSILEQDFDSYRIVVSGCHTSQTTKKKLSETFQNRISFNWIDERLPLNITFNHTVQRCVDYYGSFEGYLYVDSGVTFGQDKLVIRKLYDLLKSGPYGMVAAQVDVDGGYGYWNIKWDKKADYLIPLGKTINLHCQIFSHKLYEAYNRKLMPDIFASDTSESIFVYMCVAAHTKFVLSKDVVLHHRWGMDGGSSGFRRIHPILIHSPRTIENLCNEGRKYGFGYEECNNICRHNPHKFDYEGYPRDKNLYPFIRDNMFIKEEVYSYKQIVYNFIGEKKLAQMNIPSPKMSCILVSHNKPQLVKEAIDSLLQQTMTDWEGILIDSGILYDQGFFDYLQDNRLKVIRSPETEQLRHEKAMAPYCFNYCLKNLVNGYLVMYLCDDDILYPNAFETFVDYVQRNPNALAMYASQDIIHILPDNNRIPVGERRALVKMGQAAGNVSPDCRVDYLQFCHRYDILKSFPTEEYWSESKATEQHADGVFMDYISQIYPMYPIDIKISQNRRTVWSTYSPLK